MALLKMFGTIPEAMLVLQSLALGPARLIITFFNTSVLMLSTPRAFVFLRLEMILYTSPAVTNLMRSGHIEQYLHGLKQHASASQL